MWEESSRGCSFLCKQNSRRIKCARVPVISVLVCLGCYYRVPQTGWLINNRNLLLIVLEAGKSTMAALAHSVSGESLLSGS